MKSKTKQKEKRRQKIHKRVRSTIRGTSERPRFSVYKSNKHIYGQLVDDLKGITLTSASTQTPELQDDLEDKTGVEKAHAVGEHLAKKAQELGIDKVVFDRSGYKYHGQVEAIADGAREGGLDF